MRLRGLGASGSGLGEVWAVVHRVKNILVTQSAGNFWAKCGIIWFSRMIVLRVAIQTAS